MRRLDRMRRLLTKTKKRSDVNFKKNYVKRSLTYAERKSRRLKWQARRGDIRNDLKGIRADIMEMAVAMAEKHGNTKEYWYTRIMQEARVTKSKRKVNSWNAYQSLRLRQLNAGMYFSTTYYSVHFYRP